MAQTALSIFVQYVDWAAGTLPQQELVGRRRWLARFKKRAVFSAERGLQGICAATRGLCIFGATRLHSIDPPQMIYHVPSATARSAAVDGSMVCCSQGFKAVLDRLHPSTRPRVPLPRTAPTLGLLHIVATPPAPIGDFPATPQGTPIAPRLTWSVACPGLITWLNVQAASALLLPMTHARVRHHHPRVHTLTQQAGRLR